jgi:hypothetical protein
MRRGISKKIANKAPLSCTICKYLSSRLSEEKITEEKHPLAYAMAVKHKMLYFCAKNDMELDYKMSDSKAFSPSNCPLMMGGV